MMPYNPDARRGRDDPNRTQVIRIPGDNTETKMYTRPGHTSVMPKAKEERRPSRPAAQPQQPGPILRWFGRAVALVFALFCLSIISITLAFIAWKYYYHLFH